MTRLALAFALVGVGISSSACDRATVIVAPPEDPALAPVPSEDPVAIHAAVRLRVQTYVHALDTRDVETARASVVRDTAAYYEDLRGLALTATRDQLESLDLMSVLLVLQIRNAVTGPELETLDGAGLFERAVAEGLVGSEAKDVSLDDVWLDESGEKAEIRIEGQAVVWLRFEDDDWRIDLPTMIQTIGATLGQLARERIVRDGKVFTAVMLLQQSIAVDPAVVDGPLEAEGEDASSQSPPAE